MVHVVETNLKALNRSLQSLDIRQGVKAEVSRMAGTTIRQVIEIHAWQEGFNRMASTLCKEETDRRWLQELEFITVTEPDGAGSFGALCPCCSEKSITVEGNGKRFFALSFMPKPGDRPPAAGLLRGGVTETPKKSLSLLARSCRRHCLTTTHDNKKAAGHPA